MTPRKAHGQTIGYKRVSTLDQTTARQLDGVELDRVFEDKLSGKDMNRPQLAAMVKHVREGDTVVVHSLDRLGRNLGDLRKLVTDLTSRGVKVQFLKENLIFTGEDSPMSNLLLNMMGAFAEFERALIRERQREGIAIAKKAGLFKGRKPKFDADKIDEIRKRADAGESKADLATAFGVMRMTIYNVCASATANSPI
jgi:DNA invertase Pin-like site-specific DNA recombinase